VKQSSEQAFFGLLHLRRGDAIDDCDTSVDRMQEYFACSLNRTETLGRNITMLLTTDEENTGYRKNIIDLLDDYPHVSILDADHLVKSVVKESLRNGIIDEGLDNNYTTISLRLKVF